MDANVSQRHHASMPILISAALVVGMVGAVYGLYLFTRVASELTRMRAELEKANRGLARMQASVDRLPDLQDVIRQGVEWSASTTRKLDVTNRNLDRANTFMRQTAAGLDATSRGVSAMGTQFAHTRGTIDRIAAQLPALNAARADITAMRSSLDRATAQLPTLVAARGDVAAMRASMDQMGTHLAALDDVRGLLAQTSSSLGDMTAGMTKAAGGIDRVVADFGEMRGVLVHMDEQLAVMPQVKASLDRANEAFSAASTALVPLGEALPRLDASMQQMSKTTQEMAAAMRRLPGQGVLGIGVLAAAELLGH